MHGWFANGYLYKEFSIVKRADIDQAVRDNRVAASLSGAGRITDRNHWAETMRKGRDRALMSTSVQSIPTRR